MFDRVERIRKVKEYDEARLLRAVEGMSIKRIALNLGVSPSSVHAWTRDIRLSDTQIKRNLRRRTTGVTDQAAISARARSWARRCREKRRVAQDEGRIRARQGDSLHQAGCLLYWAEGTKSRNSLCFSNSDPHMLKYYCRFLRLSLGVASSDMTLRLNVYTGNGLSVRQIEDHWLDALELPRECLRGHSLNHTPTSSSGRKSDRLPYGIAAIRVLRSTYLLQHIYGAIQEYAGFEEARWLDGQPRSTPDSKPTG